MELNWHFIGRVVLKALVLFIAANCLWAWCAPLPLLAQISAYNLVFPGRPRLPYGENPQRAYNLSLFQLEAMFASHELARPKPPDEYRVVLIGDSSVWGYLLRPEQTLAAQINSAAVSTGDGRRVRAYNLGYPILSLTKDVLLLSYVRRYQPDLIIWPVTLESFPYDKQLFPPLVQHNPAAVRALIDRYGLRLDSHSPQFVETGWWERTLIGQRRAIADVLRLQIYGIAWAATGIDQDYPATYTPRQEDLSAEIVFHDLQPPELTVADLAFDVLAAGVAEAGTTPVLIVNEPMFISAGRNSHIRYNFFYPRWAYDAYRVLLAGQCRLHGWQCLDLWDAVPPTEYTDSAIHLSPAGEALLAAHLRAAIVRLTGGTP